MDNPYEKPPEPPVINPEQVYANSTTTEITAWDLKILFGQIEQHTGKFVTDWHTAVTMPWMQAKILDYYLQAQIAWYEKSYMPITIPAGSVPAIPEVPEDTTPMIAEYLQFVREIHNRIFGNSGK